MKIVGFGGLASAAPACRTPNSRKTCENPRKWMDLEVRRGRALGLGSSTPGFGGLACRGPGLGPSTPGPGTPEAKFIENSRKTMKTYPNGFIWGSACWGPVARPQHAEHQHAESQFMGNLRKIGKPMGIDGFGGPCPRAVPQHAEPRHARGQIHKKIKEINKTLRK